MSAVCSYANGVVSASGLPADQVINFMATVNGYTSGVVLGFTPDGTWQQPVMAPIYPTEYEFVSRTKGHDGTKYTVFCSCVAP